ncbi:hypothetical protein F7725_020312 [Dissostichus mawsoni]|uniref:Uncharacterized protein n=1 Tax=Dissostichus mawsoni TaxID=36200 RepID=A0A7J5YCV1_DISMA|nr:hypothetical protein F7725_020312 [Dissostichus mawsoni]
MWWRKQILNLDIKCMRQILNLDIKCMRQILNLDIKCMRQTLNGVECKKAQPKEVMCPPGTRGRARGLPYTVDAFMLGMGMLSYPNIVATYGRGYTGFAPSYSYQFPGKLPSSSVRSGGSGSSSGGAWLR